jgi:hypothetical protein
MWRGGLHVSSSAGFAVAFKSLRDAIKIKTGGAPHLADLRVHAQTRVGAKICGLEDAFNGHWQSVIDSITGTKAKNAKT